LPFECNLQRYTAAAATEAGLYKGLYELNPVDLELESAWFQLLNP
jgi:hypothetical protein